MPNEHDDDDHDVTQTVAATPTSITGGLPSNTVAANPTNHPDRPVNAKPTSNDNSQPLPTSTTAPDGTPTGTSDSFLPSFFPTFGVSKNTQIWIYGSVAIIVLFCAGIGTYLYLARRRRKRNNIRDDYEFEVLEDEDDDAGANGEVGKRAGKRRAGELYDAFAEESDEELFSPENEKFREDDDDRVDASDAGRGQAGIEGRRLLGR